MHQFRCNTRKCFASFILDHVNDEPQSAGVDPFAAGVVVLKQEWLAAVSGELVNGTASLPLASGGGLLRHLSLSWHVRTGQMQSPEAVVATGPVSGHGQQQQSAKNGVV